MRGRAQLHTEAGKRRLQKPRAGPDSQGASRAQGDMSGSADQHLEDEQSGAKPEFSKVLVLRLAMRLPPVYVEKAVPPS